MTVSKEAKIEPGNIKDLSNDKDYRKAAARVYGFEEAKVSEMPKKPEEAGIEQSSAL